MENSVQLEIQPLLPGIHDHEDDCLARLENTLRQKKGILRVHVESDTQPPALCLHYDPNLITLAEVKRQAEQTGASITNRYHHLVLPIQGMDCSDCVTVIEHSLGRVDGILKVNVNYALQKMWVEFDNQKVNRRAIARRVHSLGYEIPTSGVRSWLHRNRALLFSLISGVFLLTGWVSEMLTLFPANLNLTLYLAAALLGGWDIARHAWHALRLRHFDTDLLMILAALGAFIIGRFAEGALLLFLFSMGHALEDRVLDQARSAVSKLGEITPKTAIVRRDGKESELPVEQLALSDLVVVKPGMRLPVDGEIFDGVSEVDQSPVTGESIPVTKKPGDPVFAGTINGQAAILVRVTRLAKDSTLTRIMQLVEEAQSLKSPTQQTVEKFSRIYVPGVLILTVLVIILPPFWGVPVQDSFFRAMTVLVAASPCALALGAPAAILTGVTQAARRGVLVKGGVHIENLGRIKTLALDKTGTLTYGKPKVIDILLVNPQDEGLLSAGQPKDQVLAMAAALEGYASHPLALAVREAAQEKGLEIPVVNKMETIPGRGLKGAIQGKDIYLGSLELVDELQVSLPADSREEVQRQQRMGKTVMILIIDQTPIGLISLADTLRAETQPVMARLKTLGIQRTIMLTGDNQGAAQAIASQAGVTDFYAQLLPEDKMATIKQLVMQYGQVGMVGDGVNDAPALASATVGIAMGSAGSDVAFETADVALMADNLSGLTFAVGLGKATRQVVVQNLVIAMGVIAITVLAAISGWIGIGLAVILHEGSTLLVVGNALRLLRFEQR